MPELIDRPRPVPLPTGLVVKNGSKIRSRIAGSMPLAVVGDVDLDAAVGRAGADGDVAAGRAGVDGVGDQVQDDLVDLGRVAGDLGERREVESPGSRRAIWPGCG